MDKEIKRLLKLDIIPNFKLLPAEEAKLEEWKNAQKPVKVKKSRKKKVEIYEAMPNIRLEDLKVTNEVKIEDKLESEPTEEIES